MAQQWQLWTREVRDRQETVRGTVFPSIGLYLPAILDLFSKRVIGWAIQNPSTNLIVDGTATVLGIPHPLTSE